MAFALHRDSALEGAGWLPENEQEAVGLAFEHEPVVRDGDREQEQEQEQPVLVDELKEVRDAEFGGAAREPGEMTERLT